MCALFGASTHIYIGEQRVCKYKFDVSMQSTIYKKNLDRLTTS
jgi:hypothetical protein